MEEGGVRVNAKRWKYKRGPSDCYEGGYEGMKRATWIDERMTMTWRTGEDSNDGKVAMTIMYHVSSPIILPRSTSFKQRGPDSNGPKTFVWCLEGRC